MGHLQGLRKPEEVSTITAVEGLDLRRKDLDIAAKGDIVQNGRFGREVGSVVKRSAVAYYNGTEESAAVTGIHRYYSISGATQYLIQLVGNTLRVGTDSAGTFDTLWTWSGSSGSRFTAIEYQDLCYVCTGISADNVVVTDGSTAWELGACKAVISSDAGLLDTTAVYTYSIGYNTHADGTSGTGTIQGAIVTVTSGTAKGIDLSNIPLGNSSQGSRVIYRTVGGGSTLEWVHTLGDNTTTSWTDKAVDTVAVSSVSDNGGEAVFNCASAHGLQVGDRVTLSGFAVKASYNHSGTVVIITDADSFETGQNYDAATDTGTMAIGENMGTVTDDVPRGKYLYTAQERLFITGDPDWQSHVYYSDQYKPHWIKTSTAAIATTEASDYFDVIAEDDGDKITGIANQLGTTYVFKQNHVYPYYVKGTPGTWTLGDSVTSVGAPAGYSIAPSEYGIFYQGWDHVYLFNGQYAQPVIDEFSVDENIVGSRMVESFGYYWNGLYLLCYTDKNDGNAYHDRVLVYDVKRKQASIDKYGAQTAGTTTVTSVNMNCFTAFKGGSEWGQLYAGDSNGGWVYQYDRALVSTNVNTISGFNAGTHDNTSAVGVEASPKLTKQILDNMETYTTDALAQAAWVASETTEKVPPDLGDESDGSYDSDTETISTDMDYTDMTVDAGDVVTIDGNVTIKVTGAVTVNGDIIVNNGTFTLYAHTVTVATGCTITTDKDSGTPAGTETGSIVIRANTITVTGTGVIEENIAYTAEGLDQSNCNALVKDGDWSTRDEVGGTGNYTLTDYITFDGIDVTKIKYKLRGVGYDGGNHTNQVTYQLSGGGWTVLASQSGSSDSTLTGTSTTGWSDVTGMKYYSTASSSGLGKAYVNHNEMVLFAEPKMDYINSTGVTAAATDITDFNNPLECFSEDTTVNEGSYSLKVVCNPGADTLDENLQKTITSVDLSNPEHDVLLIDVRATLTGNMFQLGMGESTGIDNLVNCTVTTADTWETVAVSFAAVADGSKDAIIKLGLKFIDTDDLNTVYIDNIRTGLYGTDCATWVSPVYNINASAMGSMIWNENLATSGGTTYGEVELYTRTGSSSAATSGATTITTVTNATNKFTLASHGLLDTERIMISATGDDLPLGLSKTYMYYVVGVAGNDFQVSLTSGGAAATFADDGAGDGAVFFKRWDGTVAKGGVGLSIPTASSITSTASDFLQFIVVFGSSDTNGIYFPWIYESSGYVIKATYYQVGTAAENAVEWRYRTGYRNYGKILQDKMFKKMVSMHDGDTGALRITADTDVQDTQTHSFDIDLTTYDKRWTSNFPSTMYGRELRLEWYKNDTNDFILKQYAVVLESMPVI